MTAMSIKEEMPLLARHEGEWHGTYTFVDRDCKVIDRHESVLHCTFPTEGEFPYHQTNHYRWPDGREEVIQFPASYKDGKIYFDTERIKGYCWEVDDRVMVLTWNYQKDPTVTLYELIHLDPSGTSRS